MDSIIHIYQPEIPLQQIASQQIPSTSHNMDQESQQSSFPVSIAGSLQGTLTIPTQSVTYSKNITPTTLSKQNSSRKTTCTRLRNTLNTATVDESDELNIAPENQNMGGEDTQQNNANVLVKPIY